MTDKLFLNKDLNMQVLHKHHYMQLLTGEYRFFQPYLPCLIKKLQLKTAVPHAWSLTSENYGSKMVLCLRYPKITGANC